MFDTAFAVVSTLVEQFHANEAYFLGAQYDEASVRKDFIDKFLIALGWDVNHDTQFNPYEQEVKIENRVNTGGSKRRADYAFFTAPDFRDSDVRFFVEAKKPSRSLYNATDYHQTIRYGWNRNTPISVLTDFEEFHVIDCRYKPDPATALSRKLLTFHYSDYTNRDKFAELYFLFSREAVGNDALSKYADSLKTSRSRGATKGGMKAGVLPVDEAFLTTLDEYRDELARAIKNKNHSLNGEALTEAVQRTLDRIVFIRFLEDKGIEEDQMKEFGRRANSTWKDFIDYSHSLEPKYNGLIFKHHRVIDDPAFVPPEEAVFGAILSDLTEFSSPYNFDQIPISILGSIYERFLGKTITVTDKRAKVVDRPEVAKAGGVVYTPQYIVRYIVQRTIGELLGDATNGGKTPEQIAKMRFADIACGSGSFLIEVYTVLLDYYTRWYQAFPDKAKKGETVLRDGVPVLSLQKRREILTNNVFGSDIDFQATEVTQLSLYLKLLEEATMTETHQISFIKEKLLPDLRGNIVCGNAIVGSDYWGLFDDEAPDPAEERSVNAMDFRVAFRDVMRQGGFDSIVGNPPYVRQETLGDGFKRYVQSRYAVYQGTADLYAYFIEQGVNILKPGGRLGYIVANKWMRANYGKPLRIWLKGQRIDGLIDFGDLPVFQTVTTYPCILLLSKDTPRTEFQAAQLTTLEFDSLAEAIDSNGYTVNQTALDDGGWSLVDERSQALLDKIRSVGVPLGEYVEGKIYRGVLTGLNEAFVIDSETRQRLIEEDPKSAELIKPFLIGRDIKRYQKLTANQYLIRIEKGWTRKTAGPVKDAWEWFVETYPAIASHLKPFAVKGEKRYDKGEFWWELRTCDYYEEFEKPKIIYPNICKRPEFVLDEDNLYTNQKCFIISIKDQYLLGLLNSSLFFFLFRTLLPKLRGDFYEPSYVIFKDFPVRAIDTTDPEEKTIHDTIVALVTQRIDTGERLTAAVTDHDVARLNQRIQKIEQDIDELVYGLYGVTDEEIRIVEGNSAP
jgi:type I restriction-modification system DNA methylase subunit